MTIAGLQKEDMLSAQDVADRLGVNFRTVKRWITAGATGYHPSGKSYTVRLVARKLRGWRIEEADLQRFLNAIKTPGERAGEPTPAALDEEAAADAERIAAELTRRPLPRGVR